jgi:hypothetical protein
MAFLLGDFQNALKTVLLPYVRDNFPTQTILLDQVKRNSGVTFLNNKFYAPVRSTRHGGVGNLANDGDSTLSGTAGVGQANVSVKIMTGAFDISKLAIDATRTSEGAVTSALTFQAKALSSDFSRSANRQAFGDGSGIVAQVLASGGSVGVGTIGVMPRDVNLDDGRSIDNYGTVNGDISPTKYVTAGNLIGVGTAGAALATVSSTTGTSIVTTGAVVTAANDSIFLMSGGGIGAGTMELTGIRAALSSSTGTSQYAGLARSTTGWQTAFGSVAEALTLGRMESSYLTAKEYSQMGDKYVIFVNKTLYKKYGDILQAMRRNVNETDLLGGWTGLEFAAGAGQVGVFLDYDVPDGEVIILNLDSWTICEVGSLDWLEDPNGGGMLRLSNKIVYQAEMAWFVELLCLAPGANGREVQKTA